MQTKADNRKAHVVTGVSSSRKRLVIYSLLILCFICLVFTAGTMTGIWLKNREINQAIINSVGPSVASVEPTTATYLGKTLQYTTDKDSNVAIDRDFLFSLTKEELTKGDINDVVVLYIKAGDLGATKAKSLIGDVLKTRSSEISSAQKVQLRTGGLNL